MIRQTCAIMLSLFLMGGAIIAQNNKPQPELVDEFGQIPGEDLLARLDIFALKLRNDPKVSGLIVGYGAAGEVSGTADFQINSIRDFLVKELEIDPKRLLTVNAGRSEKLTDSRIRFWLIPPGAELPKEPRYTGEAGTAKGKVAEFVGEEYFGSLEAESWGPPLGLTRTAGIVDALQEQPGSVLYLVAFDFPNSLPGVWKRIAEEQVKEFAARGVKKERISIVYGGRKDSEGEVSKIPAGPKIELWILPREAPQPIPGSLMTGRVLMPLQIGSYYAGWQPVGRDEARFLDAIADVLRRDSQARVKFVVDKGTAESANEDDDELAKTDLKALAEEWSKRLQSEKGIDATRLVVTARKDEDAWRDYVEVWLLPPGVEIPREEEDQP